MPRARAARQPRRRTERQEAQQAEPEKLSGLAAAAKVLGESSEPLNAKQIVEKMIEKGLWKTEGKTPHATIYAAMIREIAKKGAESRFKKTDRGHFTANR